MEVQDYNDIFRLPDCCVLNRRLTKVFFEKNFKLLKEVKKTLSNEIVEMKWFATIKPSNANIPEYKYEDIIFEEVQLMLCKVSVKLEKCASNVIKLFQANIPYQIILIIENQDYWLINACDQRVNRKDRCKRIIEGEYTSYPIQKIMGSSIIIEFAKSIDFSRLRKKNLKDFYQDVINAIIQVKSATITGEFRDDKLKDSKNIIDQIQKIEKMNKEIITLKNELKNEKLYSRRVIINVEIQKKKKSILEMKNNL